MKNIIPFLIAVLLIAGCSKTPQKSVQNFSSLPDPGDTNNWSTNVYVGSTNHLVINSNQIYSVMVISNSTHAHLLVFNLTPNHFYRIFWATNSLPPTRLPSKTNSFGWSLYFPFTTAISNIDFDTSVGPKTFPTTFWWIIDDAT
jgi:hypothetical protein